MAGGGERAAPPNNLGHGACVDWNCYLRGEQGYVDTAQTHFAL